MSKKLLILGAQGSLGQALLDEFNANGYDVTGWDKEDCDIGNFEETKQKVTELAPEIIINAAAINAVDAIEEDDDIHQVAEKINGYAVGNLASIARELNSIFVHYSTDYVFNGEATEPYTEDATPDPISRYAHTKLLGEQFAQDNGEKYYIIRISRLFGKRGVSAAAKRSFVDTMLYLALEAKKEHLDVVSDQTGSPTYAPDAAAFTRMLIESNKPYGIYHGTNNGECTWFDWAQKVFKLKNIDIDLAKVPHTHFPRPASAPPYSPLANTKTDLQRSWEEALEEYLSKT